MKRYISLSVLILSIFSAAFWMASAREEQPKKTDSNVWRGHENGVTDLAFSPSGDFLVSSSLDGTIRLWNVKTGKFERKIYSQTDEIYALAVSADGNFVGSTGYERRVIISKIKNGETAHTLSGFDNWSQAVAFSPDSKKIAASGTNGNVGIWDVGSGKLIRSLESKKWQTALAWSPDGKYLAGGSVGLTLWETESGKLVKNFDGHNAAIRGITFSSDGKMLASASLDKTARIWNAESGALLKTIEPKGLIQFAPDGKTYNNEYKLPVLAVAFSPDGKQLATGGADRLVQLWDVASGEHVRSFLGHRMTVTGVKFSPGSKQIASSSLDRTIRLWEIGN